MTIFLLVVIAAVYVFVGGYVGTRFFRRAKDRCKECNSKYGFCINMHTAVAVLVGALFPLALPILAGHFLADRSASGERKHNRKLELIAAQENLAREQQKASLAAIEYLAKNGVHADVPGLYEVKK